MLLVLRVREGRLTYDTCALLDLLGRERALVVVFFTVTDTGKLTELIMSEHWDFDDADSWELR